MRRGSYDGYRDIFEERGERYHEAMLRFPRARDREFRRVVDVADLRPGHRVCDAPSGGGYLRAHLPQDVSLVQLDASRRFALRCREAGGRHPAIGSLARLPFREGAFDRVINVAGLHHEADQPAFYREAARVLDRDGRLCFADVWRGSRVAHFLDGFVHEHTPTGHRGRYLDEQVKGELEGAGLALETAALHEFPWSFDSRESMTGFCTRLFGLEGVGHEVVLRGIEETLGFEETAHGCSLVWQLFFVRAAPLA